MDYWLTGRWWRYSTRCTVNSREVFDSGYCVLVQVRDFDWLPKKTECDEFKLEMNEKSFSFKISCETLCCSVINLCNFLKPSLLYVSLTHMNLLVAVRIEHIRVCMCLFVYLFIHFLWPTYIKFFPYFLCLAVFLAQKEILSYIYIYIYFNFIIIHLITSSICCILLLSFML